MTKRRLSAFALSVTALLGLSACAAVGPDQPAPPARPAGTAASGRAPSPVAPPPARPTVKPTAELGALRPPPRPGADAPAVPPKLVGLSEDETVTLLGPPSEEAVEPPGKVWLYRAGGCQLSVHLFPDMEKGGFYALDYAADSGRDACLGKVAAEARKRGGALADQAAKSG